MRTLEDSTAPNVGYYGKKNVCADHLCLGLPLPVRSCISINAFLHTVHVWLLISCHMLLFALITFKLLYKQALPTVVLETKVIVLCNVKLTSSAINHCTKHWQFHNSYINLRKGYFQSFDWLSRYLVGFYLHNASNDWFTNGVIRPALLLFTFKISLRKI